MTRLILVLGGLLLAVSSVHAVGFEELRQVEERRAVDTAALGPHTLVRTSDALYLVDWSQPRGARDTRVRYANLAAWGRRAEFIAWGDTLVAMAPENLGPHLLIHAGPAGAPVVETVLDPSWKPATCWLGGLPYFAEPRWNGVDLLAALGGGHDDVQVGCSFELHAAEPVVGGDRAVGLDEDYLGRGGGAFQLWDLSDPLAPHRGPVVSGIWPATDAVFDGHVMYLAAGTLQAWDVSDVDAPVLLDELGPAAARRRLDLGPGGRLACWEGVAFVRIYDVSTPTDLVNWKSHPVPLGSSYALGPLDVEDDRVVARDLGSLRTLDLPDVASGTIADGGLAWPRLWSPRNEDLLAATDGVRAWFQNDDGRLVADFAGETLVPAVEPVLPLPNLAGTTPTFLRHHRGHLLHAPGDGRFFIEDVADPVHATVAYVFPEETTVLDAVLDGNLLCLRAGWLVFVFDVSAPATPAFHGTVAVEPCSALVLAAADGLLAVVRGAPDGSAEVRLHDLAPGGACPYLGGLVLADCAAPTAAGFLGGKLYVYDGTVAFGDATVLRLDVSDPAAPVLLDARVAAWDETVAGAFALDAGGVLHLPSTDHGELLLHRYTGNLPPDEPPLATTVMQDDYRLVAAAGDRVFLARSGGAVSYRVAGLGISGAGAPAAPGAVAVLPNPFNARATIAFTLDAGGPVRAELFDLRGRRVRTLAAVLPVGPATLAWDGRDGAGRGLASGVYLVRVQRPGAPPVTGRCALVR